jgi:hypothetical protein
MGHRSNQELGKNVMQRTKILSTRMPYVRGVENTDVLKVVKLTAFYSKVSNNMGQNFSVCSL